MTDPDDKTHSPTDARSSAPAPPAGDDAGPNQGLPPSPATRPDPGQEATIEGEMSVDAIFQSLSDDLSGTAVGVTRDNFSGDGVGTLAILYQRMQASTGAAKQEIWARFLQLAQDLWEAEHQEETRLLLQQSQIRLTPPENYVEPIRDSIAFADDAIVLTKVQRRFEEGDDEGAEALTQGLSAAVRGKAREVIASGARARRKARQQALTVAGLLGAFLLVATIVGLRQLSDTLANPPSVSLPRFELTAPLPDPRDYDTLFASQAPNNPEPTEPDPEVPSTPSGSSSAEPPELRDPSGEVSRETIPINDPPVQAPPLPETPDASTFGTVAAPASSEAIYDCAIATRVVAMASEILEATDGETDSPELAIFQRAERAACDDLVADPREIARIRDGIPDEEVARVALRLMQDL